MTCKQFLQLAEVAPTQGVYLMATLNSHITLIGAICLGITCVPLAASATIARSLQQQSAVARTATAITVVDFSALPDVLVSKDPFDVPEIQLASKVNLSVGTSAEDAKPLEPAQVQRLVQAVHSEIVRLISSMTLLSL